MLINFVRLVKSLFTPCNQEFCKGCIRSCSPPSAFPRRLRAWSFGDTAVLFLPCILMAAPEEEESVLTGCAYRSVVMTPCWLVLFLSTASLNKTIDPLPFHPSAVYHFLCRGSTQCRCCWLALGVPSDWLVCLVYCCLALWSSASQFTIDLAAPRMH